MIPILKHNTLTSGLIIGAVVPVIAYGLLLTLYTLLDMMGIMSDIGFAEDFRTRTLALFAICSNLITVQRYRKSYQFDTIRGILFTTMIMIIAWFFVFGIKIMND